MKIHNLRSLRKFENIPSIFIVLTNTVSFSYFILLFMPACHNMFIQWYDNYMHIIMHAYTFDCDQHTFCFSSVISFVVIYLIIAVTVTIVHHHIAYCVLQIAQSQRPQNHWSLTIFGRTVDYQLLSYSRDLARTFHERIPDSDYSTSRAAQQGSGFNKILWINLWELGFSMGDS
jgi:hypothetical protein